MNSKTFFETVVFWMFVFESLILIGILSSCGEAKKTTAEAEPPKQAIKKDVLLDRTWSGKGTPSERFEATSYGSFSAGYDNHVREIMVIKDKKTGKSYLGITGCGVTELWEESEGVGKNRHTVTVEE